jgi:hypothetical protein
MPPPHLVRDRGFLDTSPDRDARLAKQLLEHRRRDFDQVVFLAIFMTSAWLTSFW